METESAAAPRRFRPPRSGPAPQSWRRDGAAPRRRVLLLIKCLGYGGAENLLVHMVRHRDAAAFDYEVAYVLKSENTLVPDLEAAGVPVHCLGATGNGDPSWTMRLRTLLWAGDFDIMHTHLPYAATLGRMVATTLPRHRRPRIVYTEHSMWDRMALALKALNRATIGLDDRLLVVSEAARRSMPPALRRRATVVIHGIELDPVRVVLSHRDELRAEVREELGLRDGELLALTVANLRREKGYDILLRAARSLAERDVPVTFVGVGRGPCRDELIAQAAGLGLGDRFRFLGQRADVLRLLAASDMFVLPSRQEGLPVALMEASNVGMPMVVTAVGELPVLLTDGVDALLVPPEDPGALADAVTRLAADAALRNRLAAGSSTRAALFDVTRCVREVEGIYDELRPLPDRVPR